MPTRYQSILYLVAINAAFFGASHFLQITQLQTLALYFPLNDQFQIWQLFTHMFMHGGIAHILFNMYALWSFGTPLEQTWKSPKFLLFYFATGIGAAGIYTLANYYQFSSITNEILALGYDKSHIQTILEKSVADQNLINVLGQDRLVELLAIYHTPAVGASGAIYGILVAFAFQYPHAKLSLIFLPVPISAKYFVPLILLGDLFFGVTKYSVGNIAHFAHIGGAVTALLIIFIAKKSERTK